MATMIASNRMNEKYTFLFGCSSVKLNGRGDQAETTESAKVLMVSYVVHVFGSDVMGTIYRVLESKRKEENEDDE